MATGTIILRPIRDINVQHNKNTGSLGFSLISDSVPDDDSTYIYQNITGTSNVSVTSIFEIGASDLPNQNFHVTNVKIIGRASKSSGNETVNYKCTMYTGEGGGVGSDIGFTSSNLTSTYQNTNKTTSLILNQINQNLDNNGSLPQLSIGIVSTGKKARNKDDDGMFKLTQVYVELTYETIEESKKIYLKENNAWKEYSKVYIKENNSWIEKSMSEISSIFSTTANYVKSS